MLDFPIQVAKDRARAQDEGEIGEADRDHKVNMEASLCKTNAAGKACGVKIITIVWINHILRRAGAI